VTRATNLRSELAALKNAAARLRALIDFMAEALAD
jgi:hypothetical protein